MKTQEDVKKAYDLGVVERTARKELKKRSTYHTNLAVQIATREHKLKVDALRSSFRVVSGSGNANPDHQPATLYALPEAADAQ